jgi:mannosylglycerate hydrolase
LSIALIPSHPRLFAPLLAWAGTDDTALGSSRIFLNGCDFSGSQPDLPDLIEKANEFFPDREFLNAPPEQYRDELIAGLDTDKLPVVQGELRDGPASDCSGNALASRIYLKQLNKQAESLVIRREADFPTHDPGGRPWPTLPIRTGISVSSW